MKWGFQKVPIFRPHRDHNSLSIVGPTDSFGQSGRKVLIGTWTRVSRKENVMNKAVKFIITILLAFGYLTCLTSCVSTTPLKPSEATPQKGTGKLITIDGYIFPYKFYPSAQKGPSVIYIPGMSGRTAWRGEGGYALASPLNKINFNFIGFDRTDALPSGGAYSKKDSINNLMKRSKSGQIMYPTIDGKESASDNVIRNEVSSVIEFVEGAPTHDLRKGIYLVGSSLGSWISLVTVHFFPEKIKGVIFLSPAILPEMVASDVQIEYPQYFKTLINSFGKRSALAIGGKEDIIDPNISKHGSALDSAQLLKNEIGPNVEIMEVSSSLHADTLVESSRQVREKITQWLSAQVNK